MIYRTGHVLSSAVEDNWAFCALWLSLMDQDQISSWATLLERAINNEKGRRDEVSRQHSSVALTMRGSPSFCLLLCSLLSWGIQKGNKWKSIRLGTGSRCFGFTEEPGIDRANGGDKRPWARTNTWASVQKQSSWGQTPPSCAPCVSHSWCAARSF